MKFFVICLACASFLATLNAAAIDNATENQEQVKTVVDSSTDLLDINEDCHQPREIGRCFALFHRFAFNVENRQCEEFIYGGCNGNQNNFETKEDCEQKCLRIELKTAAPTELPKEDLVADEVLVAPVAVA